MHQKFSKQKTLSEEPLLNPNDLIGSVAYWDGATDDDQLTLSTIIDAANLGAMTLPRVKLDTVTWDSQNKSPQHTVNLTDQLSGQSLKASAELIVSAAGPWTDGLLEKLGKAPKSRKILAPTRGSHIVLAKDKLKINNAVAMTHPKDKRVLFAIPWEKVTIIGTTDIFDDRSPDDASISSTEVDYLLEATRSYFPKCTATPGDVLSTWSGLRPLVAPSDPTDPSSVSREHHIEFFEPGLMIIAGGKLTSYRAMCEEFTLKAIKRLKGAAKSKLKTTHRPLPQINPSREITSTAELTENVLKAMINEQMLMSLQDLFIRRTQIYYSQPDNGVSCLKNIKKIMQSELNWDESKWNSEVQGYYDFLNTHVNKPLKRPTL